MCGAPLVRDGPSTHSTYAVTEMLRRRGESLRTRSRQILMGSSSGTSSVSSSEMPCETCSKRL